MGLACGRRKCKTLVLAGNAAGTFSLTRPIAAPKPPPARMQRQCINSPQRSGAPSIVRAHVSGHPWKKHAYTTAINRRVGIHKEH